MKILIKLLLLASFIIADNNNHRCGFTTSNNQTRKPRPSLETSTVSGHFRIHYDKTLNNDIDINDQNVPEQSDGDNTFPYPDEDDNGHPDYIDELGIEANYAYNSIINLDSGYEDKALLIISDCDATEDCENLGGDALYDIYVLDLEADPHGSIEYGSNEASDGNIEGSSFIEIDNGFTEKDDDGKPLYYTTGLDAMKVTIAHELFHAIQRSYRDYVDSDGYGYFYEMSSSWIEDIIYPNIDDYIDPGWTESFFVYPGMKSDIDDTDGYSIALYAHYLTSAIGDESIIQDIWEEFTSVNNPWLCINNILKKDIYDTDFMETWVDFCSYNFFNGFYPDTDNAFYYHPDQVNAQPMTMEDHYYKHYGQTISINEDMTDKSLRVVGIKDIGDDFHIGVSGDLLDSDMIGNIVLLSEFNLDNQKIIDIHDITGEEYSGIDYVYFILGSSSIDDISFDIFFCEILPGDLSGDCVINIFDYIKMVNLIINGDNSNLLCDLNDPPGCDVGDVIELLDLIQTVP